MPKYFTDQRGVAHILVMVLLVLGLGLGLYLVTQRTNIFSRASTSSPIGTLSVSGKVFIDTNQNRQLDAGEQPYAGNSVKLSQSGNTLQTVTSDRNGDYIFSNLSAGRYRVTYTIPAGYNRVSDDSFEFTLDSNKNFNFAITPKSTATPEGSYKISGQVFVDSNSNGTFDSGESLYPAAQITIYQESTASNGDYQLVAGPGKYRISVRVPEGYERTTDDSFEFELNSDKVFNFGIKSKTAAAPVPSPTPTPIATLTSKFGKSLYLDNSSLVFDLDKPAYVRIPFYDGDLYIDAPFTIEMWFKYNKYNDNILQNYMPGSLFSMEGGRPILGFGGRQGSNKPYLSFTVKGSPYLDGKTPLEDGKWYHVAITAGNSTVKMFLNGRLEASANVSPGAVSQSPSLHSLYYLVGNQLSNINDDPKSRPFNGEIDELRISHGERYGSEFTPPQEPFAVDNSLIALYHFDGNLKNAKPRPPAYFYAGRYYSNNTDGEAVRRINFKNSTIGLQFTIIQ